MKAYYNSSNALFSVVFSTFSMSSCKQPKTGGADEKGSLGCNGVYCARLHVCLKCL
jgi:hypothetical protein